MNKLAQFTLQEIMDATGATLISGSIQGDVQSVSTDSRTATPGALFIPLMGDNFDGHQFISNAISSGATVVLTMKPGIEIKGATVLQVSDTLLALQNLARFHRRRFDGMVIAVTGSNGKTSTKDLLASVLSQKFNVRKSEKNYNNEIGLPLTLLNLESKDEICVVEMGMRGIGEISTLARIAEPDVGIITNVGVSHIERLGTQENIAKAKAELVENIPPDGTVVLNMDDTLVAEMVPKAKGRVIGFGMGSTAMIQGIDILYEEGQTRFVCRVFDEFFPVVLPVLGEHNVYNALAAIAVARLVGISTVKIQKGLAQVEMSGMRQEKHEMDGIVFINDAYNANPVSMKAALRALTQFGNGRKIFVMGDMLELGKRAKEMHQSLKKDVLEADVKYLVTVGTLSSALANVMKTEATEVFTCKDTGEATAVLKKIAQPGDIVLIKGSRSMRMEEILHNWKEDLI